MNPQARPLRHRRHHPPHRRRRPPRHRGRDQRRGGRHRRVRSRSASTARPIPRSSPSCSRPPGSRSRTSRIGCAALCRRYVGLLARELERPTTRTTLMPGVAALLDRLEAEPGVVLGPPHRQHGRGRRAQAPLRRARPARFRVGAYGSDAAHRPDLPPIAARRAEPLFGRVPAGAEVVIIGDTPADVTAARASRRARSPWPPAPTRWPTSAAAGRTPCSRTCRTTERVLEAILVSDVRRCTERSSSRRSSSGPRLALRACGSLLGRARCRDSAVAMSDRRYDRAGELAARDEVLRLRTFRASRRTSLGRPGLEGTGSPVARRIQGARGDRARRRRFRDHARRVSAALGYDAVHADRSLGRGLRARRHAGAAGELPPDG